MRRLCYSPVLRRTNKRRRERIMLNRTPAAFGMRTSCDSDTGNIPHGMQSRRTRQWCLSSDGVANLSKALRRTDCEIGQCRRHHAGEQAASRGISPGVRSDCRFASPAPPNIAATPAPLKPRTTVGVVGGVFFGNRIAMGRCKLVTCAGRGAVGVQCLVERLPSLRCAFGRRSI